MTPAHSISRFCRQIAVHGILAILVAASLLGQDPRGGLRGTVQDTAGARVASAKVTVSAAGFPLLRSTLSDDQGEFRVEELLPGNYQVTVQAEGFAPATAQLAVGVSAERNILVKLKPAGEQQTVNVEATASSMTTQPIDLASAVHQGIAGQRDLQRLPLAARSFANIAYLAPGTEPVEPSAPPKARITAISNGGS